MSAGGNSPPTPPRDLRPPASGYPASESSTGEVRDHHLVDLVAPHEFVDLRPAAEDLAAIPRYRARTIPDETDNLVIRREMDPQFIRQYACRIVYSNNEQAPGRSLLPPGDRPRSFRSPRLGGPLEGAAGTRVQVRRVPVHRAKRGAETPPDR